MISCTSDCHSAPTQPERLGGPGESDEHRVNKCIIFRVYVVERTMTPVSIARPGESEWRSPRRVSFKARRALPRLNFAVA